MPTLLSTALGAAPVFGGALLTAAAGQLRGPDMRSLIKQDLDLLDRIPAEDTQRRAELKRVIGERIDDLVAASDQTRALRAAAFSYQGNWRDLVLFVSSVLFAYVWWHVNHDRGNWLPMFIVLIIACVLSAIYAVRGTLRAAVHIRLRRR
ncbi:CPBP family intramembrane metalloprotease [Mycobacterium sp. UM_Kg1]|uniref:CPBP family intramembrane metalloprotease n=1 Tax=Mycobacterium sp. UM_Kg1 TaxID=1545691 RepID=UPI00061AB507|nr:CPBP family intramembrane metalloprotease [Mycobacterium sp. UM_Kg1]